MRARGERVRSQAPCPYSLTKGQRKLVAYECPVSGWPTHAGREEWELDTEKGKYMARLREANEDEHDLRSGRDIAEFKLPAHQGFEEVINFSSWDVYFYTRNHNSIETDRPRRHVTRLLTFPTTIAGALHENSPYTRRSMRLTHEGLRSMVALRQTLHPKLGEKPTLDVVRLIVVGARAESTLPPQVWDQLQYIFPGVAFHVFLIGPEAVPNQQKDSAYVTGPSRQPRKSRYGVPSSTVVVSRGLTITTLQAPYEDVHAQLEPFDPYTDVFFAFSPGFGFPSQLAVQEALRAKAEEREDEKKMKAARETYYAKSAQEEESRGETRSGSRSTPFRAAEGTPAPEGGEIPSAEPAPAMPGTADPGLTSVVSAPVVQAQAEWARAIGNILSTKCALIATGFSPADIERDVLAFESIEGVMGEFEWLITPGENTFASQQWVIADFDPRVAVKANWGIWAVRGKTYNINPRRASFMDRLEESAAES
ncbi:hypothetical protein CBOM_05995 [Ceraceosorus bombacis]|uniref:Uncharacterized protein n=1 Tax=Ceraceosorus bombacis TaxID=401625 RepID=A0A0P1BJM6_9BASI|nr:hypothetical protein CBOM_05995 [Ceraceosorus bombacis]